MGKLIRFSMGLLATGHALCCLAIPIACNAQDGISDFLILGGEGDFDPVGEIVGSGPLLYAPGRTRGEFPNPAFAMLVALRGVEGVRVWQAQFGSEGSFQYFNSVSTGNNIVCAGGTQFTGGGPYEERILVSCYRASDGRVLWQRALDLDIVDSTSDPRVHIVGDDLFVHLDAWVNGIQERLLLAFDARSGT